MARLTKKQKAAKVRRYTSSTKLAALARKGAAGRDWYKGAQVGVQVLAIRRGVAYDRMRDMFAITSARNTVKGNLAAAQRAAANPEDPKLRMWAPSLRKYKRTGLVTGPKTGEFALALGFGPEAHNAVPVDMHIANAMGFDPNKIQPFQRAAAKKRITAAAKELGWTPRQTMAAIWTAQGGTGGLGAPTLRAAGVKRLRFKRRR